MAHVSNPSHRTGAGLVDGISNVFGYIGDFLVSIAESNSKVRQAAALQALSDAELAERGLKRQDIARYVFADSYHL